MRRRARREACFSYAALTSEEGDCKDGVKCEQLRKIKKNLIGIVQGRKKQKEARKDSMDDKGDNINMKKLIMYTLITLALIFSEDALAQEASKSKEVSVYKVTNKGLKKAKGMVTWNGASISIAKVKKLRRKKNNMLDILRRAQIELLSGEIIYPEEVRFVLIPSGPKTRSPHDGDSKINETILKAPHGDE